MKRKKSDILKKLIQKVEVDRPTVSFTESVMNEVRVGDSQEVVINAGLKSLLKLNAIEKPALNFTQGVMGQLGSLVPRATYEPVITRKAWRIIFAVLIGLTVSVIFSDRPSPTPDGLTSYFVKFGDVLNTIFMDVNVSLYLTTIFSTGVLLLVDYLLKVKGNARVNNS